MAEQDLQGQEGAQSSGDESGYEASNDLSNETDNPAEATSTAEITKLREQTEEIRSQLQGLTSMLTQSKTEPQKGVDTQRVKELLEKDPTAAIAFLVEHGLSEKMAKVETKLNAAQQRVFYDQKAEKEFPLSDPAFKKKAKEAAAELVNNGEYAKDSPLLAYRACQLADRSLRVSQGQKQVAGNRQQAMSGEEPTRKPSGQGQPKTDPQFETLVKVFGIKDRKGMWDSYSKFKSSKDSGGGKR